MMHIRLLATPAWPHVRGAACVCCGRRMRCGRPGSGWTATQMGCRSAGAVLPA